MSTCLKRQRTRVNAMPILWAEKQENCSARESIVGGGSAAAQERTAEQAHM